MENAFTPETKNTQGQDALSYQPANVWRLRTRVLSLQNRPLLMGIINVTPDSFSDGGNCFDAEAAIEHGLRLADEGADILDIGGESTRPGATPVEAQEELRRVMPVVGELVRRTGLPVSIDTYKALVAKHALNAGAEIINDITGLTGDPEMVPLAVETQCAVCAMHMQGTPANMQDNPVYQDVVAEVFGYLRQRRDELMTAGILQERIALDPGIGFGKTTQHNVQLLRNVEKLHALGCPVLVGHSRKRFLVDLATRHDKASQAISMKTVFSLSDRIGATIGAAIALVRRGVQILRVHDVGMVRQALTVFETLESTG